MKSIYFFAPIKEKEKILCGKHKSQEYRNYMKKRVKELGIKKFRVNSFGCLNRCKLGPIVVSCPEGNCYKVSRKEDFDLSIEGLLVKRKTFKKNLVEN